METQQEQGVKRATRNRAQRKTGIERRQYERYETSISVDYSSGDTFLFSYIQNISEMGIFIRSDEPLPIGTLLQLRFAPDGQEPHRAERRGHLGEPRSARSARTSTRAWACSFRELNAEMRERIVSLVRTVAYLRSGEN